MTKWKLTLGLLFLAVLLAGGAAIFAASSAGSASLVVVMVVAVVLIFLGLVSSALGGIFSAAVYSFATTGSAGKFFREDLIKGAFREKASSW